VDRRDLYATVLKLTALRLKLERIETAAAASGRSVPRDVLIIAAEARAQANALRVAANAEFVRRRWIARQRPGF